MLLFVAQQNLNCRIQSRNPGQEARAGTQSRNPEYGREFAENFELSAALF